MNKYQIVELGENSNNAGTKAPTDVMNIALNREYVPLAVNLDFTNKSILAKIRRQLSYLKDYNDIYHSVSSESIVLLQHPFHHKQLSRSYILRKLKRKKRVKYIALVHDVEKLRAYRYNNYYKREFSVMLDLADVIIVHNKRMMDWFISLGYSKTRLVVLDIFDYIQDNDYQCPVFDKSITIAGNLDVQKSRYIGELGKVSVAINLYGPNFDHSLDECPFVHYHGAFPSNDIPSKLTKGFGLVWDGDSISDCSGKAGNYLKYNNPHKLSLYISSGLPVVIWNGAAEAGFVKEHNLGVCVDSLYELEHIFNDMDEVQYLEMANNVKEIRNNLISGYYTTKAITKAETILS